jgi:hypothetical protein
VSLSLTFEGNAINLIGRKSAFGAEDVVVKIDGEVFSQVSFHSDEMAYQQVIFSASGLSDGEHNLVIEHNECDEFIFVDAFIVNPGVKVATKAYTLEPDNIELFPNPVQDKLNVTLQNEINHGKYFIMSVDGAKIEDGVFHHFDFTINTEKLPNGSYILNAGDDNMRYIKMFVK